MARPPILCVLEKGKIIDAQEGFVDTFNWLVEFCGNLKGEGEEAANTESTLKLDRTDESHPVIRGAGKGGSGELTLIGNDTGATSATCRTGRITFATANNSAVVVTPSADASGNATLTIGVYYV